MDLQYDKYVKMDAATLNVIHCFSCKIFRLAGHFKI